MGADGDQEVVSLVKQYNPNGNDCIQESILALWPDAEAAVSASQDEIYRKFTSALNNT